MPKTKPSRAASAVLCGSALLCATAAGAAPALQPPFDAQYQLSFVPSAAGPDPIPGIPSPYGGLAFRPGDPDTLLVVGHAYSTDGSGTAAIYAIGVTRDAARHVNGFLNNAVLVSQGPGFVDASRGAGDGLGIGPSGVLFYSSEADGSLGQVKAGSTAPDKQIDLGALTPTAINNAEALAFVPQGFAGAGQLKLTAYNGHFYSLDLSADGSGTFNAGAVTDVGALAGMGPEPSGDYNEPTGLGYEVAGNPQFGFASVLVASCDFNVAAGSNLVAYSLDKSGNPFLGSARTMVSNLCADGAVVDPLTGDMLFTNFYGFPALDVLSGFTMPPPAVEFTAPAFNITEASATARISVKRYGSTTGPASVDYATSADSAVAGVNYVDVSGTLNWAAGDASVKSFTVPIKNDGVYNGVVKVNLALGNASGAALGAPLASVLSIYNTEAAPSVSLTSTDRSVAESGGTIQLSAALSKAEALPVTVPFSFGGTATSGRDYSFDLDLGGKPITSIVIPPNSTAGTLDIHIVNDLLNEGDETLVATMRPPKNAAAGAVTRNTITIQDDDAVPTVAFSRASYTISEGGKGAGVSFPAVEVALSAVSGKNVSAPLSLSGGSSDARISFSSPVVIPAGRKGVFVVMVADDSTREGDKTLQFSLGTPVNATPGTQTTTTLTIRDGD